MKEKADFYGALAALDDFHGILTEGSFRRAPPDWRVIVADIEGSTKAIEAGRYKDVNSLGAAVIVAAQNAVGKEDFPYVFGGDGATLLAAPEKAEKVCAALDGVRSLSRATFDMGLRVGSVGVAELEERGARVEVAKLELCAGKAIALFRGGGLALADKLVKKEYEARAAAHDPANNADLTGLSCRWEPIPSERGLILTVLVAAADKDFSSAYGRILRKLDWIVAGGTESANPVHLSTMSYRKAWENVRSERRYHKSAFSGAFLARAAEILYSAAVFRWKLPPVFFDARAYEKSLARHSDFRKFDDVLRMVLDVTREEAGAIAAFLDEEESAGRLRYGLHESGKALMTCFVYDTSDGGHIHFIDGGDGGYAMAARRLKGSG